jgi:hypothetical protein
MRARHRRATIGYLVEMEVAVVDDVESRKSVVDIVRELPPALGAIATEPVLTPGAVTGDIVVPPLSSDELLDALAPAADRGTSMKKIWPANMHLEMAACHLNVPVGKLVTPEDIAAVLRAGSLATVSEPASSIVAYIFVECSPKTILACVFEAGSSLQSAQRLYEETLSVGIPPAADWEAFIRDLL